MRVVPCDLFLQTNTTLSVLIVFYQQCERGPWETKGVIFWEWTKESQKAFKRLIFELSL